MQALKVWLLNSCALLWGFSGALGQDAVSLRGRVRADSERGCSLNTATGAVAADVWGWVKQPGTGAVREALRHCSAFLRRADGRPLVNNKVDDRRVIPMTGLIWLSSSKACERGALLLAPYVYPSTMSTYPSTMSTYPSTMCTYPSTMNAVSCNSFL